MPRKMMVLAMAAAMLPLGCSREEQKVPAATRPIRIAAPTREEILEESKKERLKDLEPVLTLERGVNFETPDGEKWVRFSNDMLIRELKRTNETEARWGQTVKISYALTFPGSEKVIDKRTGENPYEFVIGSKGVIKGMNMGVMGMREGGRRRIFVPPELGYGKAGDPIKGIGPEQALIFEVELLSVTGDVIDMPPIFPKPEPLGPPAPSTRPGVEVMAP